MQEHIRNLLSPRRDETGHVGHGLRLLIVLIAAVIVVAVFALGGVVRGALAQTCDDVDSLNTSDCGDDGSS
jgi:Flp pilus assembly pilin Flp